MDVCIMLICMCKWIYTTGGTFISLYKKVVPRHTVGSDSSSDTEVHVHVLSGGGGKKRGPTFYDGFSRDIPDNKVELY